MTSLEKCISMFKELAFLENNPYKRRAYENAASILRQKGEESFERRNHFKDIPGIGKSIEDKILEFKKTGNIAKVDKLRRENPSKLDPERYKVRESYITKKIPLEDAMKIYQDLAKILKVPEDQITLCGSARRKKDYVGDLDIVICSETSYLLQKLEGRLKSAGYKLTVSGSKKLSFIVDPDNMVPVDVYVCAPDKYWFMILYLTGSKNFNIKMRSTAKKLGYKLDQYGLWDKKGISVCQANSEKDIFDALGMKYVLPENR